MSLCAEANQPGGSGESGGSPFTGADADASPLGGRNLSFDATVLATAGLVKVLLFRALWLSGFVAISADELTRSLRAFQWMSDPKFFYEGAWLPFGFYYEGAWLFFWKDMFLAPRVALLVVSLLGLVALYYLALALTRERAAAVFTLALATVHPVTLWYSYLNFPAMYLTAFVTAALAFLIAWRRTGEMKWLLGASSALLLASGFRYEAWFFIVVYSTWLGVCCLANLGRAWRRAAGFLGLAALPCLFPIAWMAASRIHTGRWLDAGRYRADYLEKVKDELTQGRYWEMFFFFPRQFLHPDFFIITPLIVFGVLAFGVAMLIQRRRREFALGAGHVAVVLIPLAILCAYTARSNPPFVSDRIILVYFMALLPFAGWALARSWRARAPSPWANLALFAALAYSAIWPTRYLFRAARVKMELPLIMTTLWLLFALALAAFFLLRRDGKARAVSTAAIFVLALVSLCGLQRTFTYRHNMHGDGVAMGRALRERLDERPLGDGERVMLQLTSWSWLGVVVGASETDCFVFDGPHNPLTSRERKRPASVIRQSPETLRAYVRKHNARYICVASGPDAKSVRRALAVEQVAKTGPWRLFWIKTSSDQSPPKPSAPSRKERQ